MVREFNSLTELNVRNKKVLVHERMCVTLTHATVCVCVNVPECLHMQKPLCECLCIKEKQTTTLFLHR